MGQENQPQRLCSEIQLFDLCSRETCTYKVGRYCTNEDALARFEAIQDDDRSSDRYIEGTDDDEEGLEDFGYDDEIEMDDYDDGADDQDDW